MLVPSIFCFSHSVFYSIKEKNYHFSNIYLSSANAYILVTSKIFYFMLSSRISRNIGENIFRSYTGSTSENTDLYMLVPKGNCACLTTRWKYDVIYLKFLTLDVILQYVAMRKGYATGNNGKELY